MTGWWFNLAASSLGFTLGSVLLKRFADTGAVLTLSAAFAIFAASNLAYVYVLRAGLGTGTVASSMLQVILIVILGACLFGERLGVAQMTSVALAALSIFLMLHPAGTAQ